jgi:divalent metal cation (Fe/Co/Zn/Cd) transporter
VPDLRLKLAARARLLSWISLAYMAVEGGVALWAGAAADSAALLGFGLDSVIEGLASVIVIWRFTGARTFSEAAEQRARKAVAVTFFLLAPYIVIEVLAGGRPSPSWPGIGLAVASLIVMPILGMAKKRLGAKLGSGATTGEGTQNLLCAYLAGAVLLGLLGNALFGLWWLDPAVALLVAGLAVREGIENWRGDDCC